MNASSRISSRTMSAIRWVARILGIILFLVWGAFFVEHLAWFSRYPDIPPARIVFQQCMHLALLVGYVLAFRWELTGSMVIIGSAAVFFGMIGTTGALTLFLVSVAPGALFLFTWWKSREQRPDV